MEKIKGDILVFIDNHCTGVLGTLVVCEATALVLMIRRISQIING